MSAPNHMQSPNFTRLKCRGTFRHDGDISVSGGAVVYVQDWDTTGVRLRYPDCVDTLEWFVDEMTAKTAVINYRGCPYREGNITAIKSLVSLNLRSVELNCRKINDVLFNTHVENTERLTGEDVNLTLVNRFDYPVIQGLQSIQEEYIHTIEEYFQDEYLYRNAFWVIEDVAHDCSTELMALITKYHLQNRCVIKCSSGTELTKYKTAGFHTMYWGVGNLTAAIAADYDFYLLQHDASSTYFDELETAGKTVGVEPVYDYADFVAHKAAYSNISFCFSAAPRTTRYPISSQNWTPSALNGGISLYNPYVLNDTQADHITTVADSYSGVLRTTIDSHRDDTTSYTMVSWGGRYFKTDSSVRSRICNADIVNPHTHAYHSAVAFYLKTSDYLEKDLSNSRVSAYGFIFGRTGAVWELYMYELTGGTITYKGPKITTTPTSNELNFSAYIDTSTKRIYYNFDTYCDTSLGNYVDYLDISALTVQFTDKFYMQHGVKNTNATMDTFTN